MTRGLAIAIVVGLWSASCAAADESSRAVEAGREAMQQRPAFPWYDSEKDSLQPIELRDRSERNRQPRNSSNSSFLGALLGPLSMLAWVALALLLALIVGLIIWAWRSMPDGGGPALDRKRGRSVDRTGDLDALPVRDLRDAASLWAAAEEAYRAARYREAMIYLFSYQLLQLDRGHFILLARGKTNRQYLRELRGHDRLRGLMAGSVTLFEEAFFGDRALHQAEFEECWRRVPEFQGLTAAAP